MDKMRMESVDITAQNIDKIGAMFPNCITETVDENGKPKKAINFELLKQMLSGDVIEGDEAYEFTWVGKKAAIVEANKPIRKTLRPCPEESKDWDTTENLYIEGDNLEVLKLLQESYLNKVKMIYIDPPYNTGNDFVYPDTFIMDNEDYDEGAGYFDEDGNVNYSRENSDGAGKYHSDWCSMLYSRVFLARNLLRDDGIIFISIDDNELDDLMKICNEVFGNGNFLACFPRVTKKAGKTTDAIAKNHDYILAYSKSTKYKLFLPTHTDDGFRFSDEYETERGKYKLNQTLDYNSLQYSASLDYPIIIEGETIYPGQSYEKYLERQSGKHSRADWAWRWSRELFEFGLKNGFIVVKKYEDYSRIYTKTYQNCKIVKTGTGFQIETIERTKPISTLEFIENEYSNDNSKKNLVQLFQSSVFDYSKPTNLLSTLVQYATAEDDIIIDFFSGSATTAHAVMKQNASDNGNRKYIMVQLPEPCGMNSDAMQAGYPTICEIGKERIRRAGKKILEHSLENLEKEGVIEKYARELSEIRSLEEVYGSSGNDLFLGEKTAEGGDLRSVGSNSKSGSLDPVKHCRGTVSGEQRICPFFENSKGITSRSGNTIVDLRTLEILNEYGYRIKFEATGRDQQNALFSDKELNNQNLELGNQNLELGNQNLELGNQNLELGNQNLELGNQNLDFQLQELSSKLSVLSSKLSPLSSDYGFRVLKLDDSNMTDVYYSADEYNQDMLSMLESNVKPDRTDLDLLFGCLLEWGLPLSMPYKSEDIQGCTVHTYNDGDLIACFNDNIPESVVKEIARRKPLRAVFRDSGFASSPAKINVTEIFKLLAPDTRVKVL